MSQRSSPLFAQQLLREVEALKDQLILQHGLAHAAAGRIRQLEADRASQKASYEVRVKELEQRNKELSSALEACSTERAVLEQVSGWVLPGGSWLCHAGGLLGLVRCCMVSMCCLVS
jgi:hypothetical protein